MKLSYRLVEDVLVIDTYEAFDARDIAEVLTAAMKDATIEWPLKTLFIHRGGYGPLGAGDVVAPPIEVEETLGRPARRKPPLLELRKLHELVISEHP